MLSSLVMLGCGGFIGSHLLDRLLRNSNVRIEGWDPESSKIATHLSNPYFTLHRTSITDPNTREYLERAITRADVVMNLAAICNPSKYNQRPLEVIRANLFDAYEVIKMCAAHRKWLIHFSTSEVYGRTLASHLGLGYDDPHFYELDEEETPLIMGPIVNQRWTYACAKQMIERLIYAHSKEDGLPFTIIRPLNFFGPRMDYIPGRDGEGVPRVLACFMAALLDRTPMYLVNGGSARRTIVSIHDAIRGIVSILENPTKSQNQIFNLGNRDNETTIAGLAELMRRIYAKVSKDASYLEHPIQTISGQAFYGDGYEDCDRRMPKMDKAQQLLGWVPEIKLEDILFETISYYYERFGNGRAARSFCTT
jgi:UDP-apiose/xylose synthase